MSGLKYRESLKNVRIFEMDWEVQMATTLCYNSQKALVRIIEIIKEPIVLFY